MLGGEWSTEGGRGREVGATLHSFPGEDSVDGCWVRTPCQVFAVSEGKHAVISVNLPYSLKGDNTAMYTFN